MIYDKELIIILWAHSYLIGQRRNIHYLQHQKVLSTLKLTGPSPLNPIKYDPTEIRSIRMGVQMIIRLKP
jgi:hypothetical protein